MSNTSLFDNFDALQHTANQFREILSASDTSSFSHIIDDIPKIIDTQMNIPPTVIDNAVVQLKELTTANDQLLDSLNINATKDFLQLHCDALTQMAKAVETPEIKDLKKGLLNFDYSALQKISQSLNTVHIEAPNLALLKNAEIFSHVDLPKDIPFVINSLHSDTALRLTKAEDISFDTINKRFYVESAPENTVTVSEMNVVCSSMELLAGIDEADLISFLNVLAEDPYFASENKVGRRISEIINSWDTFIDFDKPEFYHARALKEGVHPYTNADLLKAPYGITCHGRFNHVGHNHYYFSDKCEGAVTEIKKHISEKRIQIAHLKPITCVKMIDLSEEITSKNLFLEYCRYNVSENSPNTIHREYLLPCYVASCCKHANIDGIKYYGDKDYNNYVTWRDSHFIVVKSEISILT